jgi:hypothetical protein
MKRVNLEFLDIHGNGLLESSVNTKQIITFRFLPQEASRAMTHAQCMASPEF